MSLTRIVCRLRNGSMLPFLILVCILPGCQATCSAQAGSSGVGTPMASSGIPDFVTGRVINAVTGQPVRRALVRLNNRSVLTDNEGKFQFEQNTEGGANILVSKPGFYASPEYGDAGNLYLQSPQLAVPLELRVYPEAVLTGVVLAPDGTPLSGISVSAMKSVYDDLGHRWTPVGQTQSDAHGSFRIPVPAGQYRLQTHYTPRDRTTGEAVLPVIVPNISSSDTSELIQIHGGQEENFELRPTVSPTHAVGISHSRPDRSFMRISARASNGATLQVSSTMDNGDETRIQLPQGTYTLTVRMMANSDNAELAESRITVPDHDISGVILQFSPVPSIPMELLIDGSSTSDSTPPGPSQLGLVLNSEQADADGGYVGVGLTSRTNQAFFLAPPGNYRLAARNNGTWYIKSASYGDSDLLEQELVVAPGASGTPIRITVSNQTGSLQGTVKLRGNPAVAWVYLIPNGPSTQADYSTRSSSSGSYSFAHLPPGSYQAIAFERQHTADYRASGSLSPFGDHTNSVSISVGDKPTLNLDAVPATEVIP